MARSVKIADDEMNILRAESALQSRSIASRSTVFKAVKIPGWVRHVHVEEFKA